MKKLVHVYPLPGVFIDGVPHVEQNVTEQQAAHLLAHQPPAFTTTPPGEKQEAPPTTPQDED